MIMHPARCAALTALATPWPPRAIEPAADGATVTRVALVTEAAAALGMLAGLRVVLSLFFIMLPGRYRPHGSQPGGYAGSSYDGAGSPGREA